MTQDEDPKRDRFIDSHAHLDGDTFAGDLEGALDRAREAGLTDIICVGASDGFDSNPKAIAVAETKSWLWATVGIHPHDARIGDEACLERVRALAAHEKVVAIGETGLDYHYDHSPREVQKDVFRRSLRLARDLGLPVVIHTREAEEDTIAILREEKAEDLGGVIHCFTGTALLARAALDLGFCISFSGVLTFRNGEPLRQLAKELPRDRVLVETDCPYLTPVPHRGRRNEPAFVVNTARVLSDLWGMDLEQVKRTTGANTARLFGL